MFREIRYQTGEAKDVIKELKDGKIPCVDVDDTDDFELFVGILENEGLILNKTIPFDKNAKDSIKEPEFEFRVAFNIKGNTDKLYYIDFYFELYQEREYGAVYGD